MNDKHRDQFEELFSSKLQNFEADPAPDDWDAIVGRLPNRKIVPLWQNWRYMSAAAAVILVVATATFYLFTEETMRTPLAQQAQQEADVYEKQLKEEQAQIVSVPTPIAKIESASNQPNAQQKHAKSLTRNNPGNLSSTLQVNDSVQIIANVTVKQDAKSDESSIEKEQEERVLSTDKAPEPVAEKTVRKRELFANAGQPAKNKSEQSSKKWSLGLGSGSFTAGTGNTVNTYAFRNSLQADKSLMFMNSAIINSELPKTDIHHDTPISFSLAVSRQLNDRFALQTGLSLTLLSSDWKTNGTFHSKTEQKLYFLGLPLSVVYKIAEWNRFQFYTSAGVMAEINVNGKVKNTLFTDGIDLETESEKVRMKEWLWSVNYKAGVSYPVFHFVNIFAEGGVAYFFDNGSSIETIRSEKPFNAGFNVGLRLGF